MEKSIAIIPARSGSKGLPNKNIKELAGKPLIWYSINAAKESKMFDEIMVSTDSKEYARIAASYGASVPALRSAENSQDKAGTFDVVREVLEYYSKQGREFENITILQPTSPFRTGEDIIKAFKLYEEKRAKAVVSVCKAEHPLAWYNTLGDNLSMDKFAQTIGKVTQRQASEDYYRLNGAVYIMQTEVVIDKKLIYEEDCYAYIMDIKNSVDIDTIDDFEYAEYLMSKKNIINGYPTMS